MDIALELCTPQSYVALLDSLGGVAHACPSCGSSVHGAPQVERGHISITHCAPLHVIAVADEPVGVDAERCGAGDGIESVALHPHEQQAIDRLSGDGRRRAVLETWVAKEAALKLVGCGLQIAPETFIARQSDGWYVERGALGSEPIHLCVTELDEHVVAVATHRPDAYLVVRRHPDVPKLD